MDFELRFWGENLKSSLFTPKFHSKAPFTKFQFECGVHDLVIKNTINLLNFEKREAVQLSKINTFSEKLPVILKIRIFVISL